MPGMGGSFSGRSSPTVQTRIRRLALNTTEESLRLIVLFSKDLVAHELLPLEESPDPGFRAALLRFRSLAGAEEAKNLLDGSPNSSHDGTMIVEVLPISPDSSVGHGFEMHSSAATSASSSAVISRHPSRFQNSFHSFDPKPPTPFSPQESEADSGPQYPHHFLPQSPIGSRVIKNSGKTLINDDTDDDDDLLNDPVAFAEHGVASQRRATAPQLPIGRMASLSLNTHRQPLGGAQSLPQYGNPVPAQTTPMSPMGGNGPTASYPMSSGPPYQRANFPPVNPADQNPPCNTLYVGNLPIDTSEEELKAMFSKQRGYKRLCFRTKQNGPMCFVEFEDVSFATKALHELYGLPLHNSVKGGIRLSFSKNPLGVRTGQAHPAPSPGQIPSMNGLIMSPVNGFTTANGPPPGLAVPPGLNSGHTTNYTLAHTASNGGQFSPSAYQNGSHSNSPWNGHPNGLGAANGGLDGGMNGNGLGLSNGSRSRLNGGSDGAFPPHMMGL